MFSRNEKVVYPGHGVAIIDRVIERKIAGNITQFFQLRFLNKDMTILVPVDSNNNIGIRPLSNQNCVDHIFQILSQPFTEKIKDPNGTNWNKRNKEYQSRLMNGNLTDVCNVYRELKTIELDKELSFGEKGLLCQTENLLVEEIVLVSGKKRDVVLEKIKCQVQVMMKVVSSSVSQKQL